MTLIVALGNNDQIIQISDRRLSMNGHLVDDESNKCGVLFCLNARMAFGYTGLARWQNFSTQEWLLNALHDSATPDFTIGETLERLKINATETFEHDASLRTIPKKYKRLAVMFSGYINLDGEPKQAFTILSNYHGFEGNTALDEFSIYRSSAIKDASNPTLVQRVGNWDAMIDQDIDIMREMLLLGKPSQAIVGKAYEIIRDIADRPKSGGTIGKQLTSIIIPKDHTKPVSSNYSTDYVKQETYMPDMVYLLPEKYMTVSNISVKPEEDTTAPISVPKVRKNAPCPCGSNKRYKHCHGRAGLKR